MISGAHAVIYSKDAEADRAFFRDILGFPFVDAGGGWLIFALPPAEIALHPAAESGKHEIYFTSDDVAATVGWGLLTRFTLPGGGTVGLYQPRHPLAPRK